VIEIATWTKCSFDKFVLFLCVDVFCLVKSYVGFLLDKSFFI
jgi:hypothetical protein